MRKSSCLAYISRRPQPSKEQCAHTKGGNQELAGEVEQAVSRGEARATYVMVKRLAPAPETPVTYKAGDARWAVVQLSNGKTGPCIRSGGPADKNKFGGVVTVESSGWTACASSTIGMCAGHCCSMDRDCSHRPCSARRQRRGDCFLTQTRKRHFAQPHWQGMGKSIGSSTCASSCKSCKPMPIWLAPWKKHARCNSHPGKRVREIPQLQPPSKSLRLSPRRVLVRLGESI